LFPAYAVRIPAISPRMPPKRSNETTAAMMPITRSAVPTPATLGLPLHKMAKPVPATAAKTVWRITPTIAIG